MNALQQWNLYLSIVFHDWLDGYIAVLFYCCLAI